MTVSILIPTGFKEEETRRVDIFSWVLDRWMMQFSGTDWQVCLGTDQDEPYNRSKARNAAFRESTGNILVLTDADTATSKENVLAALEIVKQTNAWVIAHSTYWSLTREYTDELLAGPPNVILPSAFSCNWRMHNKSEAGVLVMTREAYENAGGYDEGFIGWGYEDNAFAASLRQMWGEPKRTSGDVVHLDHERGLDFDQPYIEHNRKLYEAIRDLDAI